MRILPFVAVVVLGWPIASNLFAADAKTFGPDLQTYQPMVGRAVQFLASQQAEDGSLSPQAGIGPTALAALSLLRSGRAANDPQAAS